MKPVAPFLWSRLLSKIKELLYSSMASNHFTKFCRNENRPKLRHIMRQKENRIGMQRRNFLKFVVQEGCVSRSPRMGQLVFKFPKLYFS